MHFVFRSILFVLVAECFVLADEDEHVHIKVHVPEMLRKHTNFRKVHKFHFHPKQIIAHDPVESASSFDSPFSLPTFSQEPQISLPYQHGASSLLDMHSFKAPKLKLPSNLHLGDTEMFSTKFYKPKKQPKFRINIPSYEEEASMAEFEDADEADLTNIASENSFDFQKGRQWQTAYPTLSSYKTIRGKNQNEWNSYPTLSSYKTINDNEYSGDDWMTTDYDLRRLASAPKQQWPFYFGKKTPGKKFAKKSQRNKLKKFSSANGK